MDTTPQTNKHTPGPWKYDSEFAEPESRSDIHLQLVEGDGKILAHVQEEADAHLIAAAPDLASRLNASVTMMQALRMILTGAPGWKPEAEMHLSVFIAECQNTLKQAGVE